MIYYCNIVINILVNKLGPLGQEILNTNTQEHLGKGKREDHL